LSGEDPECHDLTSSVASSGAISNVLSDLPPDVRFSSSSICETVFNEFPLDALDNW
jgi:hypothetical protein